MTLGSFRKNLLAWFEAGHRELPWRNTRDPYAIWLSETMLQQTRAAAAIPYYHRFLARYPTVAALAQSQESEVLAAWSGLGYYHRARNLLRAARQICAGGEFPDRYETIRALPGVGGYTAAAVASIAFGLPYAVLDGNVMRVIARVCADGGDIGSGATRRRFQDIAGEWLDQRQAGAFNQALMELGATVCLPRNPLCLICPVATHCEARAQGTQRNFPVKAPKAVAILAESRVLLVERDGAVLLRQRPADSSLMAGFWELPDVACFPRLRHTELGSFRHIIVNTRWTVRVFAATTGPRKPVLPDVAEWIAKDRLSEYPLTTVTKKALKLA